MWIVIWLLVTLAGLIAILSIPFDILCRLEVQEQPKFNARLSWLFGLLKKDIKAKKKPAKKKEKKKPEKSGRGLRVAWKIIRTEGIFKQLKRLVKSILRSFKIRELRVDFKVGLDNPADTAFLVGIFNFPLLFWKPSFPHEIDVRADFESESILEGCAQLKVRVLPIQIIVAFLSFLFSWSSIKAIRIVVMTR